MNIEKYKHPNISDKYQQPEQLRRDFRCLLDMVEHKKIKTPAAIQTYNLLCGIEALLNRYETVSKETLLIIEAFDNSQTSAKYLQHLHQDAMHCDVFNPKMIIDV